MSFDLDLNTNGFEGMFRKYVSPSAMNPFYQSVALIMQNSVMLQFETKGVHYGSEWAPLTESTKKQRKAWGFGDINILRRGLDVFSKRSGKLVYSSENLLQTITIKADQGGVSIIAGASYAGYLQFGTSKMEARPFFPDELPADDVEDILDAFRNYIKSL